MKQKVEITNLPQSVFTTICFWWVVAMIAVAAGCESCKGAKTGVQCMGKETREIYQEFMDGFDPKAQP